MNLGTTLSQPARRAVIGQNDISSCVNGIWAMGLLADMHIVGNRIWNCSESSIRVSGLHEGSDRLLIANNSMTGVRNSLEITGPTKRVEHIEIRNNVASVEGGLDFVRPGGEPLPVSWQIAGNWRQVRRPAPGSAEAKEWIDSGKDTFVDKLPVLSLDPKATTFLLPAKDSPMGKSGAGGDLPTYVGAVPPQGVEPWDWSRTWKARTRKLEESRKNDEKR
jgi:hypothetical protein